MELTALSAAGLDELYQRGWGELRRRLQRPDTWFVDERALHRGPPPPSPLEPFSVSDPAPAMAMSSNPDELRCLLYVHPDLAWFAGHFPGRPLLPGVVQLDWAVRYAQRLGFSGERFSGWTGIKFPTPLVPNEVVVLRLSAAAADTLAFVLESRHGVHSRGSLTYRA